MTRELEFLAYAMERYRQAKGLTPAEVARLFRERGLSGRVLDNYYLYHIESPAHMVADLDSYLERGRPLDVVL
jgi:hypothetical protein